MLWAAEEVSIHKEDKLKAKDQDSLIVGYTASCRFGKNFYEGKLLVLIRMPGLSSAVFCITTICFNIKRKSCGYASAGKRFY